MVAFDRRNNDIEVHERLKGIETVQGTIITTVTRIEKRLFENGLVEQVNKHKVYWKITGWILKIGLPPLAVAGAAYAFLRS